jgi:hypothetical protein
MVRTLTHEIVYLLQLRSFMVPARFWMRTTFQQQQMPVTAFKEMHTFMYAVLEEHLKTNKGKSMVSQYKSEHLCQLGYSH